MSKGDHVPNCLHCALIEAVHTWADQHAGGNIRLSDLAFNFGQFLGDLIHSAKKSDGKKPYLGMALGEIERTVTERLRLLEGRPDTPPAGESIH